LTSPGVADIYQGDELWNYALVDPDNRRPVDYDARREALADLSSVHDRLSGDAPVDTFDGRIKLLVTQRLLDFRRSHADLFTRGRYRPLDVRGARHEHIVAFARTFEGQTCVTVAARLMRGSTSTSAQEWWGDTTVELPAELDSPRWQSAITDAEIAGGAATFRVAELLVKLPGAVVAN
jgi:(1->4)-alpha-D-glucan 1-alpha-D-glucosylmutase